jgi:hypothetical protein
MGLVMGLVSDLWCNYICKAWKEIFDNFFPLVASTAVYATALYWLFYLSSITAVLGRPTAAPAAQSAAAGTSSRDVRAALEADKGRARTAASVCRLAVGVFAIFRLFGSIGLDIEQVVQIGSVFSLGISWSMRDSLASLWASLLMTFTTDVLEGAEIRFNGEWYRVVHRWATFVECEWLHHEDVPLRDRRIKAAAKDSTSPGGDTVPDFRHFIPAALLLDRGFSIKHATIKDA